MNIRPFSSNYKPSINIVAAVSPAWFGTLGLLLVGLIIR